jgi:hypothetical protein
MSDWRTHPTAQRSRRRIDARLSWRQRVLWLARRFVVALLGIFLLAALAKAQEQPASSQVQPPQAQSKPVPRKTTVITVADAARNAKSKVDASAPHIVFTNDDAAALPPGGISVVGPPPQAPSTAKPKAKPEEDSAKLAAYWKARFTAARQKLAQDQKALPGLQGQLKDESVQEIIMDPDTGQVHSDAYMDLLRQIDAMKVAIQSDKQALSDLHEEFRHAGGLPGWIR